MASAGVSAQRDGGRSAQAGTPALGCCDRPWRRTLPLGQEAIVAAGSLMRVFTCATMRPRLLSLSFFSSGHGGWSWWPVGLMKVQVARDTVSLYPCSSSLPSTASGSQYVKSKGKPTARGFLSRAPPKRMRSAPRPFSLGDRCAGPRCPRPSACP